MKRESLKSPLARPYWLLLALVLVVAQCLAAAHWHGSNDSLDRNCALCVFGAADNAVTPSANILPVPPLHESFLRGVVWLPIFFSLTSQRNRGPPASPLK